MSATAMQGNEISTLGNVMVVEKFMQAKKRKEAPTVSMPEDAEFGLAIDADFEWNDYFLQYKLYDREQANYQKINVLTQEIRELKSLVKDKPNVTQSKIYNFASSEYEVVIPIDVTLKIFNDEVISLIPDLELYAEGSNEMESLNNLKLELLDLFDDLNDMNEEELGEAPKAWKKTLNQLIRKCQ